MDEYDQIEQDFMERHPGHAARMTESGEQTQQMQFFPMEIANQQYPLAQVPPPAEPLLSRRLAGVPVWGWGVGLAGAAGIAFYLLSQKKVTKNPSDENESPALGSGDEEPRRGGFQASRSEFAGKLRGCLQKNGIEAQTTIYPDADDAKKKLKQVSPLVTIQVKGAKVPLKALDTFAKRDGLTAIEHDAGVVGFYPGGGKKGKAWEEYVDALRDEGQSV